MDDLGFTLKVSATQTHLYNQQALTQYEASRGSRLG